jgi:cell division protein FtsI (penicillin-binding protein 3)
MSAGKELRFRVYFVYTCICLCGVAILLKALYIQKIEGSELTGKATKLHTRKVNIIADRGTVYTEGGTVLCYLKPEFNIRINFSEVDLDTFCTYIDTLSRGLSAIFKDKTAQQFKIELQTGLDSLDKYYVCSNKIGYKEYFELRDLPIFNKPGTLIVEQLSKLDYPFGNLALRTIGTQVDSNKFNGIEGYYNDFLRGVNGSRMELQMEGKTWVPIEGSEITAQQGYDVVTTLDIDLESVANDVLKSKMQEDDCEYGTVIVMEVKTGKIRALVNLHQNKNTGNYSDDQNYALTATEPGSTFKLVTLLSLLNDKYVTVNDMIDAQNGSLEFEGKEYHDSHTGLGNITIKEAFALSSNVSFAKLGIQYYYKDPYKYLNDLSNLKISDSTQIDLLNEHGSPLLRPGNRGWGATSIPSMCIGYGVKLSPMHTCMLYNAVANGGTMMKPYLVSAILDNSKPVKQFIPDTLINKIGTPGVISQLQDCLKAVVDEGTAKEIASVNYAIAGKTGTARVADKDISYADNAYQGSFIGYFPADKPEYTIAVVMRTKKNAKAYYGAAIAAPVFRMIADYIYSKTFQKI